MKVKKLPAGEWGANGWYVVAIPDSLDCGPFSRQAAIAHLHALERTVAADARGDQRFFTCERKREKMLSR